MLFFLCAIFCLSSVSAQQIKLSGKVVDAKTGAVLPYTNIREAGGKGSATNSEGKFAMQLEKGDYTLIASYIGYVSDTLRITIDTLPLVVTFNLKPVEINLPEITVLPGENPAVEIIRRAIKRKNELRLALNTYQMNAYTKTIIKTPFEVGSGGGGITVSAGWSDSAKLNIGAIFENHSTGYFQAPDKYKEIILARKQTANLPSYVNILTGGRFIQNFYSDDINFFGSPLMAPLAEDALSYYYYYITDTLFIDTTAVFEIFMTPDDEADPGLMGKIYIADGSFSLLKVDLQLNRAANTGGIFDSIRIYQQFQEYDAIPMPADYRLLANVNIMGIVKIGFEIATVLYEYVINQPLEANIFSKAVVTVVPEADSRDSTYWSAIQTIPATNAEDSAYIRIDSVSSKKKSFWEQYSFLSSSNKLGEHIRIPGPLGLYHYNRVEGHSFDVDFALVRLMDNRFNGTAAFSYGLGDKKFKQKINLNYLSGTYRELQYNLWFYNGVEYLLEEGAYKSPLQTTILSLFTKFEMDDYFYRSGVKFQVGGDVFPVVNLTAGYSYNDDKNAFATSDYTFFSRTKTYRTNLKVNESSYHTLSFKIGFDFRDYIEDGSFKRRLGGNSSMPLIDLVVDHSFSNSPGGDFTGYKLFMRGNIPVSLSTDFSYRMQGFYGVGATPFQHFTPAPGNINWSARTSTFRTLNVYEAAGDRGYIAYLEYDLGDLLFRWSGIPFLKTSELQLSTFLNTTLMTVSEKAKSAQGGTQLREFVHPFYEAGLSLGHVWLPIQLEFAWKLNHRGTKNFRISLVSFVM